MKKIYLLLGSNMGNSGERLVDAKHYLEQYCGRLLRSSSVYRTGAWGNEDQPDFLNQVLEMETGLQPGTLMEKILEIEELMGRVRTEKNAPRIIDIDILFYGHEIIRKPMLVIPHPAIQLRRFVLIPLQELVSDFVHPVFEKTIKTLLKECRDNLDVKKI